MNNIAHDVRILLWNGQISDAKDLINSNNVNDIDLQSYNQCNLLMLVISCVRCDLNFIDYLIDIGIDMNAVDIDNETALFTAVRYKKNNIVLRLLQREFVVGTVSTRTNGSEIDEAIRAHDIEITWILYSYNARPNTENVKSMNELIDPYIRCSLVAYTLIGIRKFRRSALSQHPKEIILMISGCIIRTRTDPKWTV
jgi:ankyrin repeat protein